MSLFILTEVMSSRGELGQEGMEKAFIIRPFKKDFGINECLGTIENHLAPFQSVGIVGGWVVQP